jgi:hypothetical protein
MNDTDLDAVYTQLARRLTDVGEARTPLALARFALLAMTHIGEREVIEHLIDAATSNLPLDGPVDAPVDAQAQAQAHMNAQAQAPADAHIASAQSRDDHR